MHREILISDLKAFRFDMNFEFKNGSLHWSKDIGWDEKCDGNLRRINFCLTIRFLSIPFFSSSKDWFFPFVHFQRKWIRFSLEFDFFFFLNKISFFLCLDFSFILFISNQFFVWGMNVQTKNWVEGEYWRFEFNHPIDLKKMETSRRDWLN